MIKNASDIAKCVACENPKPGAVVSHENKSAKVVLFIGVTNSGTPAILHDAQNGYVGQIMIHLNSELERPYEKV